MGGVAPARRSALVFFADVVRPNHVPAVRIEAPEVTHRALKVEPAIRHGGCHARTSRIGYRVGHLVLVFPRRLPGLGVETEDSLEAFAGLSSLGFSVKLTIGNHEIGKVDLPLRHRGPCVPQTHGHPPQDLGRPLRQILPHSSLAPDPIAPLAQPLRPIVRQGPSQTREEQQQNDLLHPLQSRY